MNKMRRAALTVLANELKEISFNKDDSEVTWKDIETILHPKLETIKSALETLKEDEEEYLEGMPDALRDSDRGDSAQQSIDHMTEALDSLDGIILMDEEDFNTEVVWDFIYLATDSIEEAQ